MRDKKVKKILLEDVKKSFQPQTTFEDVYNHYLESTKDFPKNEVSPKSNFNPFKISTLVTSILLAICIVSLVVVSIGYLNVSKYNSNQIPNDMREYIEQNNEYYENYNYDTLSFDSGIKLLIIKGYDMNDEGIINSKYYYLFKCLKHTEAIIQINEQKIALSNNSYGILASFDNNNELNTISFTINYKGQDINYSLQK